MQNNKDKKNNTAMLMPKWCNWCNDCHAEFCCPLDVLAIDCMRADTREQSTVLQVRAPLALSAAASSRVAVSGPSALYGFVVGVLCGGMVAIPVLAFLILKGGI